jgi:hypothetical protein
LEQEAIIYFQNIFKAQENLSIVHQLEVIQAYPRLFSMEEGKNIADLFPLSEVFSTLKGFVVSKSLGPDGWTIEFFDLLGPELLEVVEESRLKGNINGALNSTFVDLIPKSDKPESFVGFRHISLCNLMYKVITKIISYRIKYFLSKGISKE